MPPKIFRSNALVFLSLLTKLFSEISAISDRIYVEDNLFTTDEIRNMKHFLSQELSLWKFESDADPRHENQGKSPTSCFSWSTNLDSEAFMDMSAWKKLSRTLLTKLKLDEEWIVFAEEVEGHVNIRGGQSCTSHSYNNSEVSSANYSYTAVIFLVRTWGRNNYGELVVYDKGEIVRAIQPKEGRLVILPAVLEHIIKPPAVNTQERLYFLKIQVKFSKQKQAISEPKASRIDASQENRLHELFPNFGLLTETADDVTSEKLDIKKFITRNFTTSDGHMIVVLDDIIPIKELDALMNTVVKGVYNDDPAGVNSSDSVQWIMAFEVDEFVQKSLWQLFSQIVTFVSGKEGYYPYDIGCNNIQRGDTTTIHTDCANNENEFTLLVYLNQNWTENFHGETVFFSDMEGSEVIYAVRPRYGRVLIFQGRIPHSARPPPLIYAGARFSFAVKMSPTKDIAMKKTFMMEADILHEALKNLHGDEAEKLRKTIDEFEQGRLDLKTMEELVQQYETNNS